MNKILIVDDDPDVIYGFGRILSDEPYHIVSAPSGDEALSMLPIEQPDLVLMDVRMPGMDGLTALRAMKKIDPKIMVIIMTAFGATQTAIEAMKLGAYDYALKPFHADSLKQMIQAALKASEDMKRVVSYQPLLSKEDYNEGIIGKSAPMQDVYKRIGQVALKDVSVLITGESGTGKELVARAIYHHSARSSRAFMAINCAAIPETLLESELFGHEKGAFTGAVSRRPGRFESCDGGTIFLDEIGDMPITTQAKILRVLQEGEFERVGGSETLRVDVRVIAATNKNLPELIRKELFRSDLYYRLNVVSVELPPLRERREDIPLLTEYFLQKHQPSGANHRITISREAMEQLSSAPWGGNVRELENVIKNALATAKGSTILPADLTLDTMPALAPRAEKPGEISTEPMDETAFESHVGAVFDELLRRRWSKPDLNTFDVIEKELIVRALRRTEGNQLQAARLLGITRSTLRKRIARYGISIQTQVRAGGGRPS